MASADFTEWFFRAVLGLGDPLETWDKPYAEVLSEMRAHWETAE